MDMYLPPWVLSCMDALEQAGYPCYAVGGCVRDACLGKVPNDYDLCTRALPEQTQKVFADRSLVLAGVKHGTVGVITDGGVVEITTFRSEGSYGDSRHPDWVDFVPTVEEDLSRRDYTINAMAYSPTRGFCDPFGGREDLKDHILRTVGDPDRRFSEDALRILRGARFAVRFALELEPSTGEAMVRQANLMEHLARERVYEELCKFLPFARARDFKTFAPVLSEVIPELGPMVGFNQKNPHHAYDLYTHTALVVENVPADLTLRWAALLHDVGKIPTFTLDDQGMGHFYGHDQAGAELADQILQRLRAPSALRRQVVTLVRQHMNPLLEDRKHLRRRLSRLGWELTEKLWYLQRGDLCSKGADVTEELLRFERVRDLLESIRQEDACLQMKDLSINGNDLIALGYRGKAIGGCLQTLFDLVLEEKLPNSREALLRKAESLYSL